MEVVEEVSNERRQVIRMVDSKTTTKRTYRAFYVARTVATPMSDPPKYIIFGGSNTHLTIFFKSNIEGIRFTCIIYLEKIISNPNALTGGRFDEHSRNLIISFVFFTTIYMKSHLS